MLKQFLSNRIIHSALLFSSIVALFFYIIYSSPIFNGLSLIQEKILIFSFFAFIAAILYFVNTTFLKESILPKNNLITFSFFLIPVVAIISTIFAKEKANAFFGEFFSLDSALSLIAISFLVFILSISSKFKPKITWTIFIISNFIFTLPVMLAIILSKFNLLSISNSLLILVDNWDTVAAISALLIVIMIVYVETIAFNKSQKIIGTSLILLHLILISFIIMPDIWYAIAITTSILLFINRKDNKKIYKKISFYISIISIIMSLIFLFSDKLSNQIKNSVSNFSNINYSFVKPSLSTSLNVNWQELKSGQLFGEGPGRFYTLWRDNKTNEVINSDFWNVDFVSSYSAITTYFGTLGIIGLLSILLIIVSIIISIFKFLKKENINSLDDENKFYLFSSVSLFIFSTILLFIFGNVIIASIIFAISISLIIGRIFEFKNEKNVSKLNIIISLIILILLSINFISLLNKARAIDLSTNSITKFSKDGDFNSLEKALIRSAEISQTDYSFRNLSQFYVNKAQNILTTATNTEIAQKDFINAVNNAIKSANIAININKNNYQNYITLGIANELQSIINKETSYQRAKEAYTKAKELYPKNPYINLILARLQYSYDKDINKTESNISSSLQIKENYSLAYYLLSQLSIEKKDNEAAKNYALKAIQVDNRNVDAYIQYGLINLNEKNLREAESAFLTVLKLDNQNINAIYYLAAIYILAEKYDIAKQLVDALKIKLPNSERVLELESILSKSQNQIKNETENSKDNKKDAKNNKK